MNGRVIAAAAGLLALSVGALVPAFAPTGRSAGPPPASTTTPASTTEASVATTSVSTSSAAPTSTTTASTTTTEIDGTDPAFRQPGWIESENRRPGTTAWRITADNTYTWIDAYLDHVSIEAGSSMELFVDTPAPTFSVTAYRMGWYGGAQAREVWRRDGVWGMRQPPPVIDKRTGLAEARWLGTLRIDVTPDWPPGAYLLRLDSSMGASTYVPVTVRDDQSLAAVAMIQGVTTWQAYNGWGACSLYECLVKIGRQRADIVSFDRPYLRAYGKGSADFIDHELSMITLLEQEGYDATYLTDVDLDARPLLAEHHKVVISPGHDEYYSTAMKRSLEMARNAGVNLMFLGANAVYRRIRLEPSWDGRPARREVNYRTTADPANTKGTKNATVSWREAPLNEPESKLVGVMYECAGVAADWRVVDAKHWIYAGTNVHEGQLIPGLVANEYDRYFFGASPIDFEAIANSRVTCHELVSHHNAGYFTVASGAGVFATGTIHWECSVDAYCTTRPVAAIVRRMTLNVLEVFAAGPAGLVHPSVSNVARYVHRFADEGLHGPPTTVSGD